MVNPREDTTIQSCFSLSLLQRPLLSNKKQWSDIPVCFFLDAFCLLCCICEDSHKSGCWKLSEYDQSLKEEIALRSDSCRRETPIFMGLLLDYYYCYSSSWWISQPVTAAADKGVKEKREGRHAVVCTSLFLFLHLHFLIPWDPVSKLLCGYTNFIYPCVGETRGPCLGLLSHWTKTAFRVIFS